MVDLLFEAAMSPSQDTPIPVVRLPSVPVKIFSNETHVPMQPANGSLSHTEATMHQLENPLPLAEPETWRERFKRLTGHTIDQHQGPPDPIQYDTFDDPVKTIRPSGNATNSSSSTEADAIILGSAPNDHEASSISTPPSTAPEISYGFISSQTAALLMEGAKANWKNICEALLVGVSPDDKDILQQITFLVDRLGTGSGPLSLAHRPYFAAYEEKIDVNMGIATVSTRKWVEEEVNDLELREEAIHQPGTEEEASQGEKTEEEGELQARRERIAMSLLMRRQEQPIKK
ncbi:MAG: hypothetical protein Q9205_007184 [Flavoplaca limonia]